MQAVCKLAMRVLLVSILFSLVFVSSVGAFSGEGEGTELNPYQITDVNQLQEMKNDLAAYYILANDIDASDTVNWNEGAGFEPIGKSGNHFIGTFDGQGYVIHNFFINRPETNFVGLMGYLGEGSVKNVGLENVNVSGKQIVGSLVGWSISGSIADCYATGVVSGSNRVGGLVGRDYYGTIAGSRVIGAVIGNEYWVGGLVGHNNYGSIVNSYATGAVSGTILVGGLVGNNSFGTIASSYATGEVTGNDYVGGLIGYTWGGTVSNSYATGEVTGNDYVGGLVGWRHSVMITDSFWDTETSGQESSDGGTGKTTEEMMDIRTYTDTDTDGLDEAWDMVLIQNYVDETWYIDNGKDYPRFGWEYVPTYEVIFNVSDSDGDPLMGATVNLNGMEQTTGSDGSVKFEEVLPGSYTYEVSKDGYDTESGGIEVIDEDVTEEVTLYLKYLVEWLPPLTNLTEYTLRDGTTLPIKFQLIDRDGNIVEEVQEGIYLKIEDVETWELGDGGDALRFDDEDFHYIANFHTRNYDLENEETFVAEVYDIYKNLIGRIEFQIDSQRGTSRGRGR